MAKRFPARLRVSTCRFAAKWSAGDALSLQLNMAPQILEANAQVTENYGRVAVQRGPLVVLHGADRPRRGVALKDVALSADRAPSAK